MERVRLEADRGRRANDKETASAMHECRYEYEYYDYLLDVVYGKECQSDSTWVQYSRHSGQVP
jgi:hypothetical protein